MKVNNINSNYYNYQNSNRKNQSFGNLVPTKKYVTKLIERNIDKETIAVAELSKIKINLRSLLNYDIQPFARKQILDEFFSLMPEEEVEDLTISLDASFFRSCNGNGCHQYFDDKVTLIAKLPQYNSKTYRLEYKDYNFGFTEHTDSFNYDYGSETTKTRPLHDNKLKKQGFQLGHLRDEAYGDAQSIPNQGIFEYIAQKINELIDSNVAARDKVREEKVKGENETMRRVNLFAMFKELDS